MKTDEAKRVLSALVEQLEKERASAPEGTKQLAQAFLGILGPLGIYELSDLKLVNRKENIGSLLIKFGELSRFGKSEWVDLIRAYDLDLALNPRDSARDVMGRLARHLRDNPKALESLAVSNDSSRTQSGRSSKRKRPLAENLQDTLNRLLDE